MRRWDPEGAAFWERELGRMVLEAAGGQARLDEARRKLTTGWSTMREHEAKAIIRRIWRLRTRVPKLEYFVPDKELGIRSVRVMPREPIEDVIGWYLELYGSYP